MTRIGTLTVYSTRGGNGKTIISLMLAIAAVKRGLKTVIIDADLEAPSLLHLIKPIGKDPEWTWVDFLEDNNTDIASIPTQCNIEGLDAIFSPNPKIGKAFLSWKSKEWWTKALKKSMIAEQDLHEAGYDLIVIDNQSGTSLNSVNNMVLADATVMVIRPATYGLGAAETFIHEMYKVLRGLKPRVDYYLWNQVQNPANDQESEILDNFLSKWDNNLKKHGLHYGGRINFSTKLNLGLLGEKPDLIDFYPVISDPINNLLDNMFSIDLSKVKPVD